MRDRRVRGSILLLLACFFLLAVAFHASGSPSLLFGGLWFAPLLLFCPINFQRSLVRRGEPRLIVISASPDLPFRFQLPPPIAHA